MSLIKIKNLTKRYHKKVIVKNFNYEFIKKLYVINGENGCGKSTIIKCITNIINKTSGTIISKTKIAYLPEVFTLPQNITSHEFLKVLYDKTKASKLLEEWNIENKLIKSLSKGNRQKLGILLTSSFNSKIYIFDEPTDGLDFETVEKLKSHIKDLMTDNCVIIISHHEQFHDLDKEVIKISDGVLCED